MGSLGYRVFEKLSATRQDAITDTPAVEEELVLHLKRKSRKSGKTIEADCKQTAEGFVVLRGSLIETIDSESIPPGIKELRQKTAIDENGILQEDVLFRSPSYAAAFVIGGHVNGLTAWVAPDGRTLKEIEDSETVD